jgi:hypothetical protein
MDSDEINNLLSRSNYVGFFDLIGLMIADGVYNYHFNGPLLRHTSFSIDHSIYGLSFGLSYGNPEDKLPTNLKRTFCINDDLYYTVNKKVYRTRREANDAYDYLMPNKVMSIEMIKVFKILFKGLVVKWSDHYTYRSFLNTKEMMDNISSYEIKQGVFNDKGGLVFHPIPNSNLVDGMISTPFWRYITKYKMSNEPPFDI